MTGIYFKNPWLLLILIPAIAFALYPYFKIAKKYRRNRNRIISLVLHMLVLVLSVGVLSGMTYKYDIPYLRNEVILLVDASSSSKRVEEEKDSFIRNVLDSTKDEYQVGIVLFGYGDPVYVAPLSYNTNKHLASYMSGYVEDDSATDIASALRYAKELLSDSKNGKIVLVTDGHQTDGDALATVLNLAAEGVKVDTIVFNGNARGTQIQINGIDLPDYSMAAGDVIEIAVRVHSQAQTSGMGVSAKISLFDNDVLIEERTEVFVEGENEILFTHTVLGDGLHEYKAVIDASGDLIVENNIYITYSYLEKFDKLLILQRAAGEADSLASILSENYTPTVMMIGDAPLEVDALREYDQVILVNIANADMPEGFVNTLQSYVSIYGGGMLTVGGTKMNSANQLVPNTYDPDDMYEPLSKNETLYQKMLPIQSIEYTPPLALSIVIDRSGSMDREAENSGGQTLMDIAKLGATDAVNELSERDRVGIVSFYMTPKEEIPITPITSKQLILEAISKIQPGGDTAYSGAIEMAARSLQSQKNVERRHIIFITDGEPLDQPSHFNALIKDYYDKAGITMSVFSIGATSAGAKICQDMADFGGGTYYNLSYAQIGQLPHYMKMDVTQDNITTYNPVPFTAEIRSISPVLRGITQNDIPELGGYYGTKARSVQEGTTVVLGTGYVPIYAAWKFGKGSVGSFMSELNGPWSENFRNDPYGKLLINNMVRTLFPVESLRVRDIQVMMTEENYRTHIALITNVPEDQYVEITAVNVTTGEDAFPPIRPEFNGDYVRVTVEIRNAGVYRIDVQKKYVGSNEVVAGSLTTTFKSFSYSKEYDQLYDEAAAVELVEKIAVMSGGTFFSEAEEVFRELEFKEPAEFDPRWVYITIALVALLLDIAVRKFKFKWPHEIYRDYKQKKALRITNTHAKNAQHNNVFYN